MTDPFFESEMEAARVAFLRSFADDTAPAPTSEVTEELPITDELTEVVDEVDGVDTTDESAHEVGSTNTVGGTVDRQTNEMPPQRRIIGAPGSDTNAPRSLETNISDFFSEQPAPRSRWLRPKVWAPVATVMLALGFGLVQCGEGSEQAASTTSAAASAGEADENLSVIIRLPDMQTVTTAPMPVFTTETPTTEVPTTIAPETTEMTLPPTVLPATSLPAETAPPTTPAPTEAPTTELPPTTLSVQEIQEHVYDHVDCENDQYAEIVPGGWFNSLAAECGLKPSTLISYNPGIGDVNNVPVGTIVWLHKGLAPVSSAAPQSNTSSAVTLENCDAHGGVVAEIPAGFTVMQHLLDLGIPQEQATKIHPNVISYFGLKTLIAGNKYCLPDREGITVLYGV